MWGSLRLAPIIRISALNREWLRGVAKIKMPEDDLPEKKEHDESALISCLSKGSCRYLILFLLCYSYGSIIYGFEMLGGIQNTIIKVMRLDSSQYALLYSAFTWPSVIICLIGGLIIDRVLGVRTGLIASCIACFVGQTVLAIGAAYNNIFTMIFGRYIFGAGLNFFMISMHTYQAIWFLGKEINFSMSMGTSVGRLSGGLAIIITEYIYEWSSNIVSSSNHQLGLTIMFNVMLLVLAVLCSIFVVILDIKAPKLSKTNRHNNTAKNDIRFCVNDWKVFSPSFWLTVFSICIFIPLVFIFVSNGQLFFINRYSLNTHQANLANSFVFLGVTVLNPFIGIAVDIVGYNLAWAQAGTSIGIVCHFLFIVFNSSFLPYITSILFSASYSLFKVAMWPLIALMVEHHQLATAYGLLMSPYNMAFGTISILSGIVIDYIGYYYLELLYMLASYTTFLTLSLLMVMDALADTRKLNIAGWKHTIDEEKPNGKVQSTQE